MQPGASQQTKNNEAIQNIESGLPHVLEGKVSSELWVTLTYEQQDLLRKIEKLPSKLMGVVPESVWSTLSIDQKLEFFFTHDLLPKGGASVESSGAPKVIETPEFAQFHKEVGDVSIDSTEGTDLSSGEVFIEGQSESQVEFEEVKGEIGRIEEENANEIEEIEEEYIAPEDVERIKEESGTTFNTRTVPRFAGYQPSDNFLNQVDDNINGSPNMSGTWASVILRKFWDALTQ